MQIQDLHDSYGTKERKKAETTLKIEKMLSFYPGTEQKKKHQTKKNKTTTTTKNKNNNNKNKQTNKK